MSLNIRGLLIWFIATLFVVYAFFLNTAGAVFSNAFKESLHLSDVGAVFAVGSFIFGFACMQIPAGYLLDRFSIRIVASGGLFLLAIGNLTLTESKNLPLFAISNFIQGIGASFAFISVGKLIGEWFVPKIFPILFGLTQTISCISTAIIHYYLVKALESFSWQTIYIELSAFGFALFVLMLLFVKSPPHAKAQTPPPLKMSLSTVLKNKQMWLCSVAAGASFGALLAYGSFWYMQVEMYFSTALSASLVISGLIFAGVGIGTPFFGWLSNKIQSRKLAIHISVVPGTIFLIMGLYLPRFSFHSYFLAQFISFCIGFFLSGSMLYYTCVSELSSANTRAAALGLINTSVFIFNTALLFIPQFLVTQDSKSYFTYLWILPVCVLISIFLAYFTKETAPHKEKVWETFESRGIK